MYLTVLTIHSWVRWAALVLGVGATLAVLRSPRDAAAPAVDRWGAFLTMTLDLQMLLGLLLYLVVSPNMRVIRENFGEAMKASSLRFWAVEHIGIMFVAVILVHVGRVLARRATTPSAKRTRLLVCYGLATLSMIAGIPWPGMASGRPLFRL